MSLILWLVIGATLGAIAAEQNGSGKLGAAAVGALLGPLALFLFLIKNNNRERCPKCRAWTPIEAEVCSSCSREKRARRNERSAGGIVIDEGFGRTRRAV